MMQSCAVVWSGEEHTILSPLGCFLAYFLLFEGLQSQQVHICSHAQGNEHAV